MVYNPITEELFTAVRGHGAFLNGGDRLAVSEEDDPGAALLITEIGVGRDAATVEAVFGRMANIVGNIRAIRVRLAHGDIESSVCPASFQSKSSYAAALFTSRQH